jgi:hypothetical protein
LPAFKNLRRFEYENGGSWLMLRPSCLKIPSMLLADLEITDADKEYELIFVRGFRGFSGLEIHQLGYGPLV